MTPFVPPRPLSADERTARAEANKAIDQLKNARQRTDALLSTDYEAVRRKAEPTVPASPDPARTGTQRTLGQQTYAKGTDLSITDPNDAAQATGQSNMLNLLSVAKVLVVIFGTIWAISGIVIALRSAENPNGPGNVHPCVAIELSSTLFGVGFSFLVFVVFAYMTFNVQNRARS